MSAREIHSEQALAARANYDRLSRWYDWLAGRGERRARQIGLDLLRVEPGESVLEIGCGTGAALVALAHQVGPHGYVEGIDVSPGMIGVARARIERHSPAAPITLRCGDVLATPLGTDRFDAQFMSFTLELFAAEARDAVLQQCRRALRRDGRLCVVALARSPGSPGLAERLYSRAQTRFPRWIDCHPINVTQTLTDAGFAIEKAVQTLIWGLPVAIVLTRNGRNTK